MFNSLTEMNDELINCTRCGRLMAFRNKVAIEKRKQFLDWEYWGRPVPGYGDQKAKLLIVGLAPAAHGGNRTGRVFTGDKSAAFLMKCLYDVGFVNQPYSSSLDDGLILYHCYMTPVLKCVPPQDRPRSEELQNCFYYFQKELEFLLQVKTVLALGKIAFDGCLKFFREVNNWKTGSFIFGHNVWYSLPEERLLIGSYHPSPRNVNTGRLTYSSMIQLLEKIHSIF